jgi:hypothetical protein
MNLKTPQKSSKIGEVFASFARFIFFFASKKGKRQKMNPAK